MAIATNALVQSLFIAHNKQFQDALTAAEPDYLRVATPVPSTTASNIYAWLGMFPKMREWIGQRVVKDMKEDGYSIVNKKYETTVGIPLTAIEDDTVGIYSPVVKSAGTEAAIFPGRYVWGLLKDGETHICYDGQNYFDEEHPVAENEDGTGAIKNVSNILKPAAGETASPAWYVMVTTQPIKPLFWQERVKPKLTQKTSDLQSDHVFMHDELLYGVRARGAAGMGFWQMCVKSTTPLTPENFEKACLMIEEFTADGGTPLNFKADLLVVPPALKSTARRIVKSKTVNGDDNPNFEATDLLVTPWIK